MSVNLENRAVATGLEKLSFHSNTKERQRQRMLKLVHNCTVVWTFFGIAFLWDYNENWPFCSPVATTEFSKFADMFSAAL